MSTPGIYSENQLIRLYMNGIRKGSSEAKIDHLWSHILGFYWPVANDYGVEREAYVEADSLKRTNLILTKIKDEKSKRCLYIECKRSIFCLDKEPREGIWETSVDQLREYMVNGSNDNLGGDIYGIVSIGLKVRFYIMSANSDRLQRYGGNSASLSLSLRQDSGKVHTIMDGIRRRLM